MLGNGPVPFGKGATEKGCKVPRRCPTSFGRSEKGWPRYHLSEFQTGQSAQQYLAGPLPYTEMLSFRQEFSSSVQDFSSRSKNPCVSDMMVTFGGKSCLESLVFARIYYE